MKKEEDPEKVREQENKVEWLHPAGQETIERNQPHSQMNRKASSKAVDGVAGCGWVDWSVGGGRPAGEDDDR
ncbi:hypothetical protein DFQ29_010162 [Apophysomyces sp. BC1021]|nr:hypothetical protein DFQ29_010162 [Apophysomyces sp. BC1021]